MRPLSLVEVLQVREMVGGTGETDSLYYEKGRYLRVRNEMSRKMSIYCPIRDKWIPAGNK